MDLLDSLLAIASGIILLGSVVVVITALILPKEGRGKIFRKVGRWFQGL
jgi:hypothetical protein